MYKQVHMTENVACSKAVKKSGKLKTSVPCLQVMFVNICLCVCKFSFLVRVVVIEFVCRVTATVVSLALFCLGAHYHNPPSERVFHYPFVLSVLMTGNQMDVDKSRPRAPTLPILQHLHTTHTLLSQITLIVSLFSKVPKPKRLNKGAPWISTTHQRQSWSQPRVLSGVK